MEDVSLEYLMFTAVKLTMMIMTTTTTTMMVMTIGRPINFVYKMHHIIFRNAVAIV